MIQFLMGELLDETLERQVGNHFIYIVRDGETILYVGQSFDIYSNGP